jgi:hypothetical protein
LRLELERFVFEFYVKIGLAYLLGLWSRLTNKIHIVAVLLIFRPRELASLLEAYLHASLVNRLAKERFSFVF